MKFESKKQSAYRNQLIVDLASDGKTQSAIGQLVHCSQSWVSHVLAQHEASGDSMLTLVVEQRGKTCLLSHEDLEKLPAILSEGALKHNFDTDNWTRERIADLIAKEFGVRYHPSHISKLMRKINFTVQKPKRKAYEQVPEEIQKWQNETLPALKKSP